MHHEGLPRMHRRTEPSILVLVHGQRGLPRRIVAHLVRVKVGVRVRARARVSSAASWRTTKASITRRLSGLPTASG